MISALITAIIVIAIVFAVAHLIVRFVLVGAAAEFGWLVYLIAALIAILVLWGVIAPVVGPLP
jgi:hypothetical protein